MQCEELHTNQAPRCGARTRSGNPCRSRATVDFLTDGRLQLGLGAGSIKSEYDEAGFSFDPGGMADELIDAGQSLPDRTFSTASEVRQ